MPEADDVLIELANAVADGAAIDWRRAEAGAATPDIRAQVLRLERIARIGELHSGSQPPQIAEDLHASIRPSPSAGVDAGSDAAEPVRWGPFTIVEKIGRGTFGDVYRALEDRLDRVVALKLLRRKPSETAAASDVIEEARLMAKVRHPNVTAVFGADRIDGRVGLWMEFIDGRTLEDELRARGRFASSEVARVGAEMARALGAVHQAGLVHGDIKAANVMRSRDGRLYLTDFGTGQMVKDERDSAAILAGSPLYLAPEVLAGEQATPLSDVYSLGVLLFHLATGSFPVRGRSINELREVHASGARESVRVARPDIPRQLATVIETATRAHPSARFATATGLARACDAIASGRRRAPRLVGASLVLISMVVVAEHWAKNRAGAGERSIGTRPTPIVSQTPGASSPPVPGTQSVALGPSSTIGPPRTNAFVTTNSTRARELYGQAADVMSGDSPWDSARAQQLLNDALAEDPSFASAHVLAAWAIANQIWASTPGPFASTDVRTGRMLAHLDEALRHLQGPTSIEQYFIAGSSHELRGHAAASQAARLDEFQQARTTYEGLLRQVPDDQRIHYWTLNNLSRMYVALAMFDEARELSVRLSDSRPNSFGIAQAAAGFLVQRGDMVRARVYAERAKRACDRPGAPPPPPGALAWVRLFDATDAWLSGDTRRALQVTDAVAATISTIDDEKGRAIRATYVTRMYLTLGRLNAASGLVATLPEPTQSALLAQILWQRHDLEGLVSLLRQRYALPARQRGIGIGIQVLLVPAGLFDEARSSVTNDDFLGMLTVRGQLAAAHGEAKEAVLLFEQALAKADPMYTRYDEALLATDALASTLDGLGDSKRAIETLERLHQADSVLNHSSGYAWLETQTHLASLYRGNRREADAKAIDRRLLQLLAVADKDHPLVVAIRGRPGTTP